MTTGILLLLLLVVLIIQAIVTAVMLHSHNTTANAVRAHMDTMEKALEDSAAAYLRDVRQYTANEVHTLKERLALHGTAVRKLQEQQAATAMPPLPILDTGALPK